MYRLFDARSGRLIGSTLKGDENGLYETEADALGAAKALNEFVYDNTWAAALGPRKPDTVIKGPFFIRSV